VLGVTVRLMSDQELRRLEVLQDLLNPGVTDVIDYAAGRGIRRLSKLSSTMNFRSVYRLPKGQ
jgi:hypothetical protein